jgi:trk system potassium uptake protein TrkA
MMGVLCKGTNGDIMFGLSKKENGLKIIIVGCGKVGANLVDQLSKEGHDITVIDKKAEKIQDITNIYDVMGLVGNGASYSTQMEAGIEETDLIIAVTDSDELNLLCCTVAKRVGKCAAIARVRTPDYSEETGYLREQLGLALIINPELEAAREVARILYLPTALEVNSFAHGQAELVKFKVPEGNLLNGLSLAYLGKNITNDILICAVERNGEVYMPNGDFVLHSGDVVSFVSERHIARDFLKQIGLATRQVKDTMIIGASKAAYYLAKELLNMGISVKIIEKEKENCESLSVKLPKAIIINGDGTDPDILKEEGIETVQSFIPLTGIDEENIMLTLYAKQVSKAKVVTKINRVNYKQVINNLDLGSLVYPKYITSEAIIAYVRAKKNSMGSNIETLYHMFDSRVEAIEFIVEENSKVSGVPIKDLKLKKDVLISFINHNGHIIIPTGNDKIEDGDTVMIVTKNTGFTGIDDIVR